MSKQDVKIFLLKAIMIRGSRRILSKELGVSPQVINSWLNGRVNIPLQYALLKFSLTEGEITWQSLTPYLKDTATLRKVLLFCKHFHYSKDACASITNQTYLSAFGTHRIAPGLV